MCPCCTMRHIQLHIDSWLVSALMLYFLATIHLSKIEPVYNLKIKYANVCLEMNVLWCLYDGHVILWDDYTAAILLYKNTQHGRYKVYIYMYSFAHTRALIHTRARSFTHARRSITHARKADHHSDSFQNRSDDRFEDYVLQLPYALMIVMWDALGLR
jgi:hypothetical protein